MIGLILWSIPVVFGQTRHGDADRARYVDEAVRLYPEIFDDMESAISKEFNRLLDNHLSKKSPILRRADVYLLIAEEAARNTGAKGRGSLELKDHFQPVQFGTRMDPEPLKRDREQRSQMEAMRKVETFGFYAVAKMTVDEPGIVSDGRRWTLERGETFPFLGFDGAMARLKLGSAWIQVPRGALRIVKLADHPELKAEHDDLVARDLRQFEGPPLEAARPSRNAPDNALRQLQDAQRDRQLQEQRRSLEDFQRQMELERLRARQR